jgi:TPR repeat protein
MRLRFIPIWAASDLLALVSGAWAQSSPATATQSIATLKKQAAGGDAKAQCNLAGMYEYGIGVRQDFAQAARLVPNICRTGGVLQ